MRSSRIIVICLIFCCVSVLCWYLNLNNVCINLYHFVYIVYSVYFVFVCGLFVLFFFWVWYSVCFMKHHLRLFKLNKNKNRYTQRIHAAPHCTKYWFMGFFWCTPYKLSKISISMCLHKFNMYCTNNNDHITQTTNCHQKTVCKLEPQFVIADIHH